MSSSRIRALDNHKKKDLVIVIAGPTGVGKSDVAAALCKENRGMIVSADSVQAFRGVQIGANKPTLEERRETPHLLVDVVDASEDYNAAEWRRDALTCVELLLKKNLDVATNPKSGVLRAEIESEKERIGYTDDASVTPVVVGGTMMYIEWLVHGRPDAVRPTKKAVQKAHNDVENFQALGPSGWEKALSYVASLNPVFDNRIRNLGKNDWYRLRRTIEIAHTVLEKDDPSQLEALYSGLREGGLEDLGYDVRCFFLCPNDRMQHTTIVDRRCEEMILHGLLEETTNLLVSQNLPGMATKAIGYRQVLEYLQRTEPRTGDADAFDAFLNDFTTATRRYAKKQMQWFRKNDKFLFVPVSLVESKSERVQAAANLLNNFCRMSRQEYEEALASKDAEGKTPPSLQTRIANEEQGKGMKFYKFQRYKLERGSKEFDSMLAQADECTARIAESPTLDNRSC